MAAIDDLRTAVADLTTAAQAEHDELDAVVSALGNVEGQLTQLQTQISQGGGVAASDLDAVTQSVSGIAAAARQAVESAKANPAVGSAGGAGGGGAPAPAPAPGPAPAPDPGTAPAPAPAPDPGAPTPAPAPAPAPGPEPSAPASDRPVYVFAGDVSTVDSTVWPSAGIETAEPTPRPLFHYSGDTQNPDGSWTSSGDGVGGVWQRYTGPTQPVGGAAPGTTEA